VIGEPAAQRRAEDGCQAPHGGEKSLIAAAFERRENVAQNREHQTQTDPRADSLQAAEHDQLVHSVQAEDVPLARYTAQARGDDEHHRSQEEKPFPAVNVGELREDRNRHGGGEQIGGAHPRVAVEPGELRDDTRHRGADDGLIERGEKQREHQAGQRTDQLRSGQPDKA
jgi:hypothetical protein